MANPNSTLPIARVFSNLFRGLPRLILTNILFALPTAVFFSIFYAINTLTGLHSVFILLLTVIPVLWVMARYAPAYLWYSYLIAYIIELLVMAGLHFLRPTR